MTVSGDNSGIFSTGDNAVNIQVGGAPVRSQYLVQVRRIAPPELYGRRHELTELAAFCTASSGGYAWWRAKAWSGKSALMSWFVLHPPPRVRIVSFFVTARLAAQNDRGAFIENVLEQLLSLLGESMPPFLTDSTRESHLLARLADAAEFCRSRGEHLVLLVDGLDEDRGVHEHSIAALLPVDPPAGTRVIVAGRPHPPVPEDVPPHHPLRDPAVIRTLSPSSKAEVIRVEMQKDLKRLLTGSSAEQDLLGLVTAAGGGLTALDLAELTGELRWQIDDRLATVTGRSFTTRDPYFESDNGGREVFLLGHEELQVSAMELIGPGRLAAYRDRLHDWARGYRDRRWPANTPEYLLFGYFRLLVANDDVSTMVACVTHTFRQDRLLAVTGSDTTALSQTRTAMESLAAQDVPDLVALTRLAIHRDHLTRRNADIPVELPAVWAALGRIDRAESIAESIASPGKQAEALALVVQEVLATGNHDRAVDLLDRAGVAIAAAPSPDHEATAALATALAMAGSADKAQAMANAISPPNEWGEAMRSVVAAVAATRDVDRAEAMAETIDNPYYRGKALAAVAAAFGRAGRADRLTGTIERVHRLVDTNAVHDMRNQVDVLVSSAIALTKAWVTEHISDLVRSAEAICDETLKPSFCKRRLTEAWVAIGDLDRAATFPWTIDEPREQITALMALARGLAAAGRSEQAAELLEQSIDVGRRVSDEYFDAEGLALVVEGFAAIGDADRAVRIALSISPPWLSAIALARLAAALVATGESRKAPDVLARAERIARATSGINDHTLALTKVADRLARCGATKQAVEAIDHAERIAHAIRDEHQQLPAMSSLATTAALCGDFDRVERICSSLATEDRIDVWTAVAAGLAQAGLGAQAIDALKRAGPLALAVGDSASRWSAVASVVQGLSASGDLDRAENVAASVPVPNLRSGLSAIAVTAAARAADAARATEIVGRIERAVRATADSYADSEATHALVEVLALSGNVDRAEQIASSVREAGQHRRAHEALARAAVTTGDLGRAAQIINSTDIDWADDSFVRVAGAAAASGHVDYAVEIASAIAVPYYREKALLHTAQAVAKAGDVTRAEQIARMITYGEFRAEALLTVLRARPSIARHAVAEVLTLADWELAAPEVVATASGALGEILSELEAVYSAEVLGGVEQG